MNNLGKALLWLGLVVGVVALLVQFVISMQAYLAAGRDIPGALGAFFIQYTVLANIGLVLVYLSELTDWRWLEVFRKLDVTGVAVASALFVMILIHFLATNRTELTGLFRVCDITLNYVAPLIFIVWWLVGVRHGPLLVRRIPVMLLPTFIYFLVVIARGAWVREYPYTLLDARALGYGHALLAAVGLTLALGAIMLVVVGVDEFLGRWSQQPRRVPAQ